jgi:hypothetical protein
MSENQVNPDYVDAPYEASGFIQTENGLVWFIDREVDRDPMIGIKVRRTNQDTGELICNYVLDPMVVDRENSRTPRTVRFYHDRRRKKLANCVPYRPGVDSFENLPTPDRPRRK